jgi:hypothetical protein
MEIREISAKAYDELFPHALCFNKAAFNRMNDKKCEEVHYLIFIENKIRLGLIIGSREACWESPFSAPFGGFSTLQSGIRIHYIEQAVDALEQYAFKCHARKLVMTLPPLFYDEAFLTKTAHVLYRQNWLLDQFDLDYYCYLSAQNDLLAMMSATARQKVRMALRSPFTFEVGEGIKSIGMAYDIVARNRSEK